MGGSALIPAERLAPARPAGRCGGLAAPGSPARFALAAALACFAASAAPERADALDSDQAAAQAMIREGIRQLEAGNAERAIRQFERAVQLAPADPFAYLHLARAHSAAGRAAEAHKVLAKAAIHTHGDKKLLYELELTRGDILRGEGKVDAARAAYQKAVELRFFNREARERLQALQTPASPAGKE